MVNPVDSEVKALVFSSFLLSNTDVRLITFFFEIVHTGR